MAGWRGKGDGDPAGGKGMASVRESGKERAGCGILKVVGCGRNKENLHHIAYYLNNRVLLSKALSCGRLAEEI